MKISIPTVDSLSIHNQENLPEIQDDTSGTKYNNEQLPVSSTRLKEILISKSAASLENSIHRFDKSSKLYAKDPYSINSQVNLNTPKIEQPEPSISIDTKKEPSSIFDVNKRNKKTINKIYLKK